MQRLDGRDHSRGRRKLTSFGGSGLKLRSRLWRDHSASGPDGCRKPCLMLAVPVVALVRSLVWQPVDNLVRSPPATRALRARRGARTCHARRSSPSVRGNRSSLGCWVDREDYRSLRTLGVRHAGRVSRRTSAELGARKGRKQMLGPDLPESLGPPRPKVSSELWAGLTLALALTALVALVLYIFVLVTK
jgi:hypothetical protein